jgi:superfamily I DNA and/or RNA helicase
VTFRDRDTKEWKNAQKKVIADAKIIFSTLSMTGNKKFEGLDFDYLIVDEACQSNELETLIAM